MIGMIRLIILFACIVILKTTMIGGIIESYAQNSKSTDYMDVFHIFPSMPYYSK